MRLELGQVGVALADDGPVRLWRALVVVLDENLGEVDGLLLAMIILSSEESRTFPLRKTAFLSVFRRVVLKDTRISLYFQGYKLKDSDRYYLIIL